MKNTARCVFPPVFDITLFHCIIAAIVGLSANIAAAEPAASTPATQITASVPAAPTIMAVPRPAPTPIALAPTSAAPKPSMPPTIDAPSTLIAPQLDNCSPFMMSKLSKDEKVAAERIDVERAITMIDNAKIEFSSPSLASGEVNYITISPSFAENISAVCILGYFVEGDPDIPGDQATPFDIDHVEIVKALSAETGAVPSNVTKIFFRAPVIADFDKSRSDSLWRYWAKHPALSLKFAAFNYKDGQKVSTYFGREVPVNVSHSIASMGAALLFAIVAYFTAALTILNRVGMVTQTDKVRNFSMVPFLKSIMPWQVVGTSGQASLSQLQMLVFTIIVSTLLFYQWVRTGLLQDLSTDLLYLIGISTVGAAGTEVTKTIKKNLDQPVYDYAQSLGWFAAPMMGVGQQAKPSQLLLTNNRFDIYKFQMLLFTFVIAAYVIVRGSSALGNVSISATMLSLMGISHGAYMGGRATADTLTPLQDTLLSMQVLQNQYYAPGVGEEYKLILETRFYDAAKQAAEMFTPIFDRDIPDNLMRMPPQVLPVAV